MNHTKNGLSLLFSGLILGLNAQQAPNASGATHSSASGSVSYSIGQVFYESDSNANGSSSQGVQQAYEIYTLKIDPKLQELVMSIYPNPTSNQLNLDMKDVKLDKLVFELLDTQGKTMLSSAITTKEFKLDLTTYPVATYFLNIIQEDKTLKSFKIVKN